MDALCFCNRAKKQFVYRASAYKGEEFLPLLPLFFLNTELKDLTLFREMLIPRKKKYEVTIGKPFESGSDPAEQAQTLLRLCNKGAREIGLLPFYLSQLFDYFLVFLFCERVFNHCDVGYKHRKSESQCVGVKKPIQGGSAVDGARLKIKDQIQNSKAQDHPKAPPSLPVVV